MMGSPFLPCFPCPQPKEIKNKDMMCGTATVTPLKAGPDDSIFIPSPSPDEVTTIMGSSLSSSQTFPRMSPMKVDGPMVELSFLQG